MRKLYFYLFITLFIGLILPSCAPQYIPSTVNTPIINGPKELNVHANLGISGFDPQVSYSINDKFAVMLNGSFSNWENSNTGNFHKHNYGELMGGYYYAAQKHLRLSIFGGIGAGKLESSNTSTLWTLGVDVLQRKIVLQPSIAYSSDVFDIAFTPRFSQLNIYQRQANSLNYFFLEPVVTLKFGYKYLKITTQAGLSIVNNDQANLLSYQPFIFAIGLEMKLGLQKKKQK